MNVCVLCLNQWSVLSGAMVRHTLMTVCLFSVLKPVRGGKSVPPRERQGDFAL